MYTCANHDSVQTVVPSLIPSYASACSGSVRYSSACACVSATPTITTASGYVIVSPTSCPFPNPSPTGTAIGKSDNTFSAAHGGLTYQQFADSTFILSNATSGPYYADFSDPQRLVISDTEGDTLIIYSNGTYLGFAGNCELEFVGSWKAPLSKRDLDVSLAIFARQVSSALCNTGVGVAIAGFGASYLCASLGADLGAEIGGGIGFLGNLFGPEVGIPTTLLGVALGGQLGAFIAGRFGQSLCGGAATALTYDLCQACPPTTQCGPGTITCNNGPCQDALSDPNNCGKCGNVVSSRSPSLTSISLSIYPTNHTYVTPPASAHPESAKMPNAPPRAATAQHATTSTAAARGVSASEPRILRGSVVRTNHVRRWRIVLLVRIVHRGMCVRRGRVVGGMSVCRGVGLWRLGGGGGEVGVLWCWGGM